MSSNITPPPRLLAFFRWFIHPDFREEIEGDLHERYFEYQEELGMQRAWWRLLFDILTLFRPALWRPLTVHFFGITIMLRQNLKISFRNLRRNRSFSLLNILGLACGLAVFLLIGLWIRQELNFDNRFAERDRIGRILQHRFVGETKATWWSNTHPVADVLRNEYDHLFDLIARSTWQESATLGMGEDEVDASGLFMDPDGPSLLELDLQEGTARVLTNPDQVLLSVSTAEKLLGTSPEVGTTFELRGQPVQLGGVFADLPEDCSFSELEFVASWELFKQLDDWVQTMPNPWYGNAYQTLVRLAPEETFENASEKIVGIYQQYSTYAPEEIAAKPELFVFPMRNWHLRSDFENGQAAGGLIDNLRLFGIIGLAVLLLACINFINLSTARAERRSREVGVRKAIGSRRHQLVGQFLVESVVLALLSFVFATILAAVLRSSFNEWAQAEIPSFWLNPFFWGFGLLITLATGFLSGIYPAVYLSAFSPIAALRGRPAQSHRRNWGRQSLVVFQFTIAVGLIVGVLIVNRQIQFGKDRARGYDSNQLVMTILGEEAFLEHWKVVEDQLLNSPAIEAVARASSPVTEVWATNSGYDWPGKDPEQGVGFAATSISPTYGATVDWKLLDGRNFSPDLASDTSAFLVNTAAVKHMELSEPVGTVMRWDGEPFTIIGVVDDIVVDSPFGDVRPHIYYMGRSNQQILHLRLSEDQPASAGLLALEDALQAQVPDHVLESRFVDESFARKFATEERLAALARFFTVLAIIISCLGLLGLAAYLAERRRKEMSIRKVLGATALSLWQLLSQDFVRLILAAAVIGVPLSWYLLNRWLEQFSHRTNIPISAFLLAVGLTLGISLVVVSSQTIRAALRNPVEDLSAE